MAKKSHVGNSYFHRVQIGRAQRYIRLNFYRDLTLKQIAKEAGASTFHFVRVFFAYTGETPFDFLRRIRIANALAMLQEDPQSSVTEIALDIGYATPSSFNKVFKTIIGHSPRDFRNLGKEVQDDIVYHLNKTKEIQNMKIESMTNKFETITWPEIQFIFSERRGPFAEVAPLAWQELYGSLLQTLEKKPEKFLGMSSIDNNQKGSEAMIYQAGIALVGGLKNLPKGIQSRQIKAGKYAKFRLVGSYSQIWAAFDQIFRILADSKIELRDGFCMEDYLNDPKTTPENELITDLLVPIR